MYKIKVFRLLSEQWLMMSWGCSHDDEDPTTSGSSFDTWCEENKGRIEIISSSHNISPIDATLDLVVIYKLI